MRFYLVLAALFFLNTFAEAQNAQWSRNYIGSAAIFKTVVDDEGSSYAHGRILNTDSIDFEPGTGNHIYRDLSFAEGYFITKHDSVGNLKWVVFLSTWMYMEYVGGKIFLSNTTFGRVYFTNSAGLQRQLGQFTYDPYAYFIMDKNGMLNSFAFHDNNTVWFFLYDSHRMTGQEVVYTGVFEDTINFGFFHTIIATNPWQTHFLMRQNKFGVFKMAKALDFGSAFVDFPLKLSSDTDKHIIYAAEFTGDMDIDPGPNVNIVSSDGPSNLMILKYDSMGNYVQNWHMKSRNGVVQLVDFDVNGNFIIAGELKDSINLSLDGTDDWIYQSQASENFIAYYNPNGSLQWHREIPGNVSFKRSMLKANGEIFLTGSFSSSLNLDPGVSNFTISSNTFFSSEPEDEFLVRYDHNGDFNGALRVSAFEESIGGLALGPNDEVYIHGWFYGFMSSPSNGLNSLSWQLSFHNSPFLIRSGDLNVSMEESLKAENTIIYPNPGNGLYHIEMTNFRNPVNYRIVNTSGITVQEGILNQSSQTLDINSMKTGLYIFVADDGNKVYREKIIKN